ncbi:M20 family metallopeptidase [Luteimonas marina]|uniref:M20 family metallopeptidase n=1 Tax=Luteimonas marina TaxID=488485 RepID=A0A5C5U9J3_9GAMM|nr:M20 family metallopeptidase [Luteimonas marina]TWT22518.1 M20 family metallopeptidase [Luteimonas marina]
MNIETGMARMGDLLEWELQVLGFTVTRHPATALPGRAGDHGRRAGRVTGTRHPGERRDPALERFFLRKPFISVVPAKAGIQCLCR